ncbi:MAG TPA: Npt1/Npt2 family nucleotide transporter, partial [Myxococcota bacterium]
VQQIGTENLLLCQMVLLSIGAVIINDVGTRERHRLKVVVARDKTASSSSAFKVQSQARHIFASKHLKIIAGMTVATFVTVPLVDYQFKVLVKEHFTTNGVIDTDAMSSFMGLFSAATGVVAAVMQLGITGRLLERFGIVAALLLLPVSLLCGLFALLSTLVNAFVAVVFTKGAENSLRYSITDATMQVLYTPVPSATRGRAKTFIDGVIKPISGGVAGAAMVLLVGPLQLPITSLAVVAVVLLAGWLGLIMLIRSEYVRELLATLRKRRLDFSQDALVINDAATVAVLRHRLRGSDVVDVRNAIELCRRVQGHDLTAELLALLDRDDRGVRKAALELIARQGRPGSASVDDLARLQALIASTTKTSALSSTTGLPIGDGIEGLDRDADITDDDVHAAAVSAYCAVVDVSAGSDAVLAIAPLMTDAVPVVRGAAVAGIIRHGGDAGLALASDPLEAMLADDDEAVRLACARVLEQIARPGLHGPAAMLMRDDNPRVRLGAIAAAGAMRAPELVAPLIEALSDVDTGRAAQVALAGYGDVVIPQLSRTLRSSDAGPRRRQVPRVLERIGTKAAFEALLQALVATPSSSRLTASKTASSKKVALVGGYVDREHDGAFGDVDTRRELARSCARLRDRLNLPVDEKPIRALIAVEIARHYQLLATTADLGALAADPKTSLLRDALDVRRERSLDAIFRLLAVIQPLKVIETVLGNLRSTSSTARANAIEVLDNLLDADDKRGLLPIVECAGELRDAAGELASRGPAILERAIERGEKTGFAV